MARKVNIFDKKYPDDILTGNVTESQYFEFWYNIQNVKERNVKESRYFHRQIS